MNASTLNSSVSTWFSCFNPKPEARIRLFCFAHAGGEPQAFFDWSEQLSKDIEVYSICLPGRSHRLTEPPSTDLSEIITGIIEELLSLNDKLFAFFGHSAGALLCLETAREIQRKGYPKPLHIFISAYSPPHLTDSTEPMHKLPDAELIKAVLNLGIIPKDISNLPDLKNKILIPLRADLNALETHRFKDDITLTTSMTVLGGKYDKCVNPEKLVFWRNYTTGSFALKIFKGDHFYTISEKKEVLNLIRETMEKEISELPLSIIRGKKEYYLKHKCLTDLFNDQLRKTPENIVVFDGDNSYTLLDLDKKSDLLANYLQACNIQINTIVGIYMEPSVDFVVAMIAILKAGGAFMSVDLMYPEYVLKKVLESARPPLLLTKTKHAKKLSNVLKHDFKIFQMDNGWENKSEILKSPIYNKPHGLNEDSLAFCAMTSGTTGIPKIILCPHRGSLNVFQWLYKNYPYSHNTREAINIFFEWEILRPIFRGFPAFIIPDMVVYDPVRLISFLAKNRITRIFITPSLLEQILNEAEPELEKKLQYLKIIFLGGELVLNKLKDRCFKRLPHVTLLNRYGSGETVDVSITNFRHTNPILSPKYTSIGIPISNIDVWLLDKDLRPVPKGVLGELYISGPTLAHGYLDNPQETKTRFLTNPNEDNKIVMFRTGDLARVLENGQIEVRGRIAFMVKLRGYSIVLSGIETAIKEHPDVKSVTVIPEYEKETRQAKNLIAYVITKSNNDRYSLDKLLRPFLKKRLPPYSIPSFFIPIDELPINQTTGKLDRKKLPVLEYASGKQELRHFKQETNKLEDIIASVMKDVLHIDAIEKDANFFDIGGHSFTAIETCAKLSDICKQKIYVTDLYSNPSVKQLSAFLSGELKFDLPVLSSRVKAAKLSRNKEIAIIGIACRFPGAGNAEQFWKNLCGGVNAIKKLSIADLRSRGIPENLLQADDYIKVGALLDDVDIFDYKFWNIKHREAELMDPQHRIFLECCWKALEDAGYAPLSCDRNIGVFGGCYLPLYLMRCIGGIPLDNTKDALQIETGNDKDFLTTRVSWLLNLHGPSLNIQTACSSSLANVASACQSLINNQCNMALAGAVSITFPQGGYHLDGIYNSPDGIVRAYDNQSKGTVFGDGVGVVLLKKLEDAVQDHDNILSIIKNFSINNNGNVKSGFHLPDVAGQVRMLFEALEGIEPETISHIEGNGIGTFIGDMIELEALNRVFKSTEKQSHACTLGSVKTNIGQSNVAAGMASLIKTILSLKHNKIPPTINSTDPNPHLADSRFKVNSELINWNSKTKKRAGVTCLGIGGTNVHMILEEAPVNSVVSRSDRKYRLLTLSAKTEASLENSRKRLIEFLRQNSELDIVDIEYTLHKGREHFRHRMALVCMDIPSALTGLEAPMKKVCSNGKVVFAYSGLDTGIFDLAFALYNEEPLFRKYFKQCLKTIGNLSGEKYDAQLINQKGFSDFVKFFKQSVSLSFAYSVSMTLQDLEIIPDYLTACGSGEIAAACVAGSVDLENALNYTVKQDSVTKQNLSGIKSMPEYCKKIVHSLQSSKAKIPFYSKITDEKLLAVIEIGRDQKSDIKINDLYQKQDTDKIIYQSISSISTNLCDKMNFGKILAKLWTGGLNINWDKYHCNDICNRASLPAYSFDSVRCWIEAK